MIRMNELREIFAVILDAIRQPDFFVLGALFIMGVMGFVIGWAVCEAVAIRHQIMMNRYHKHRRDD